MPEEIIDQQPKETAIVGGESPDVLDANAQAWTFLESVLGRDPVAAWALAKMEHTITGLGKTEWVATFKRDPDYEAPPIQPREISDEEYQRALADDAATDSARDLA